MIFAQHGDESGRVHNFKDGGFTPADKNIPTQLAIGADGCFQCMNAADVTMFYALQTEQQIPLFGMLLTIMGQKIFDMVHSPKIKVPENLDDT